MASLGGLFGGGPSAPKYSMSPEYRGLTIGTAYPKIQDIINSGGISYDTAGAERVAAEDIAGQYGQAYNKVRSLLPYGNTGSMNRANMMFAQDQARETSRATTGLRTGAAQGKIASLLQMLGLTTGMQDPNLAQYYADIQKYQADVQKRGQTAGLVSGLIGLAATPFLGPAAPAVAGMIGGGGGYKGLPSLNTNSSLADFYNTIPIRR